jgi:hypothetical protein
MADNPRGEPAAAGSVACSRPRSWPWIRLLRSVRLAVDPRKLLLAAFGLVVFKAGWDGLTFVFRGSSWQPPTVVHPFPFSFGRSPIDGLAGLARLTAEPFVLPVSPFARMLSLSGGIATFFHATLSAIWAVLVWAIVGGAITRIALVQATTGETTPLARALRFATKRGLALIGGPLSPFVGVGFFAILCALFGLLYQATWLGGPVIAGFLFFLPLLAGVMIALILIGLALGWPLMIATVVAENEDAFDSLSRSYGYVQQRPGAYAFYALLSWGLGIVGLFLVTIFAGLVVQLAAWGVAFGAPDDMITGLLSSDAPESAASAVHQIHAGWVALVGLLVNGFAYSFFWTAVANIYLLLRHDVDGGEWDRIYRQ